MVLLNGGKERLSLPPQRWEPAARAGRREWSCGLSWKVLMLSSSHPLSECDHGCGIEIDVLGRAPLKVLK